MFGDEYQASPIADHLLSLHCWLINGELITEMEAIQEPTDFFLLNLLG